MNLMPKRKGVPGPATTCTPAKIAEICALLERGTTVKDACAICDIHKTTFFEWRTKGEAGESPWSDFLIATEKARAIARMRMVDLVFEATRKGGTLNPRPAQWFLERSDRDSWCAKVQIEQVKSAVTPQQLLDELAAEGVEVL